MKKINTIYTFSKKVKGKKIEKKEIIDDKDIKKLLEVMDELRNLSGAETQYLKNLGLRANSKDWIREIIKDFPEFSVSSMEYLLKDFTDSMKTRMREDTKHAIALLNENVLFLCHSAYGEETITPEWKIMPRMLDRDNVLRYVSFFKDNRDIKIRYWERSSTTSFMEWLDVPSKRGFLFGGKYRIRSEAEGVTFEVQLNDKEMEDWLEDHSELSENEVRFDPPITILGVDEIKAGSKSYDDTGDFIQDFRAERYGILKYQRAYYDLKEEELPLLIKYFDEEHQVVEIEGDTRRNVVNKAVDKMEIIFADKDIELRSSYLKKLRRRLLNDKDIKLFHAGMDFRSDPLELCSLKIYNNAVRSAAAERLSKYYKSTKFQDPDISILFKYAVLKLFAEENKDNEIHYFASSISESIIGQLSFADRVCETEGSVLEFKSRDIFTGKDKEIANYLTEDINKKLSRSPAKLYIIGLEDDGAIDPIPSSKISSDRLDAIVGQIKQKNAVKHLSSFLIPVKENSHIVVLDVLST